MINTVKFEGNSIMVPPFILPLDCSRIDLDLVSKLITIVENEEDHIKTKFNPFRNKNYDNPDELNGIEDWVSNRAFEYNLLNFADTYSELIILKQFIYDQYLNYVKELNLPETKPYIQVWFNVLRKNSRYFTKHHHAHASRIGDPNDAYISGNICIRAENTKTYYYSPYIDTTKIGVSNIPGESVMFPSWVVHSTDQNISDTSRISIAFDIITEEMYNKKLMNNPTNYIPLYD